MKTNKNKKFLIKSRYVDNTPSLSQFIFNTRLGSINLMAFLDNYSSAVLGKYPNLPNNTYSFLQIHYLVYTLLTRCKNSFNKTEITQLEIDEKISLVHRMYHEIIQSAEFKSLHNLLVFSQYGRISVLERSSINRVLDCEPGTAGFRRLTHQGALICETSGNVFSVEMVLGVKVEDFENTILPEIVIGCFAGIQHFGLNTDLVVHVPKAYLNVTTAPSFFFTQYCGLILNSINGPFNKYKPELLPEDTLIKTVLRSSIVDPDLTLDEIVPQEEDSKVIKTLAAKGDILASLVEFFKAADPVCRHLDTHEIFKQIEAENPTISFVFEEAKEEEIPIAETISEEERAEMLASLSSMGLLAENVNSAEEERAVPGTMMNSLRYTSTSDRATNHVAAVEIALEDSESEDSDESN